MTFDKGQERTVKVSYWVAIAKQPPGQLGRLMALPQEVGDKEIPYDSAALTPGAELKVHEYYRRLFAYYQQNDHGKALALGKHFETFLKTIVDRDGPMFNDPKKKHWQPQLDQFRKTEQEHKDVSAFVAAG